MSLPPSVHEIKKFLTKNHIPENVNTAVILGSGLGEFVHSIKNPISIPYEAIPGMPSTSVYGHSGELFFGTVNSKTIIAFSGRFHLYEGHDQFSAILPVQIAKAFNTDKLIISNAAGGINSNFKIGDLMVIDDVIRLFEKITSGPGEKFQYIHHSTANKVRKIAATINLDVQRGTYLYVKGPNYETKAEINAFKILGADVVGMSTVPELIEASRLKLKTAAISLVTNMAAGISGNKLDHSDVKKAAETRKDDFSNFVSELITSL